MPTIITKCKICGKEIKHSSFQKRVTCSKTCQSEYYKNKLKGKNNPNYRHGKTIENRCADCGVLIDHRSIYCNTCRGKNTSKEGHRFYGGHHSEKTKKLIGQKSKEKFTETYLEKIREKHKGMKKRTLNGYILINDYEHPNRDSQNNVLEHVLVMTEYLGRALTDKEIIHHIDGNRKNNKLENLYLSPSRSSHMKTHQSFNQLYGVMLNLGLVMFDKEEGKYRLIGGDK